MATRTALAEFWREVCSAHVILPCIVLTALAAPTIWYMIPAYEDLTSENYQPLQALKFYRSLGSDFHKYGPMGNFLLAPPYAASLAIWWLTGSFARPSGDFPYGFEDPLWQVSALIVEGRALFLALFLGCSAYFLTSLCASGARKASAAVAFLVCVGTSCVVASYAANTRPDGPMLAFALASMGVYARILRDGASERRLALFSLLAVFAISSKELAAFLYPFPYLALGARLWRELGGTPEGRRRFTRLCGIALGVGIGSYAVLNIVYAPATWLLRMEHWLIGSGADPDVWLGVAPGEGRLLKHLGMIGGYFVSTLGPGGLPIATAAVASLCAARPPNWAMWMLPFLSFLVLGLLPLGYGADKFLAVGIMGLAPAVAFGLSEIEGRLDSRRRARAAWYGAVGVGLLLNALFGTFAWIEREGRFPLVAERAVERRGKALGTVNLLDPWSRVPGKSRLEWKGFRIDPRSISELQASEPESRPEWILVQRGFLGFLDEARWMPARAEMLGTEGAGVDVSSWVGVEALGYRLDEVIEPRTPWWFLFDWVPTVALWKELAPVHVYRRSP